MNASATSIPHQASSTPSNRWGSICILFTIVFSGLLAGCSVMNTSSSAGSTTLSRDARWVLLPIANHTEVPQAGLRAETITEALLRGRGLKALTTYPATLNTESLMEPAERKVQADAAKWAREQGMRYGVQGAVDEWRYKVGVDGEPAVGIALQVIDLQSGEVVWSAVGARSGWSREALSAVAQKLISDLLARAPIQ
jgi:TolB-like protein